MDVRFVHVALPSDARTISTRLMWWQPENSGLDMDHWAIDELLVSGYTDLRNVDDDFDGKPVTVDICYLSVVVKSLLFFMS